MSLAVIYKYPDFGNFTFCAFLFFLIDVLEIIFAQLAETPQR